MDHSNRVFLDTEVVRNDEVIGHIFLATKLPGIILSFLSLIELTKMNVYGQRNGFSFDMYKSDIRLSML